MTARCEREATGTVRPYPGDECTAKMDDEGIFVQGEQLVSLHRISCLFSWIKRDGDI